MFSTILKEVTGYFDRRTLLSTFFPSLVFWGLTIAVLVGTYRGWQKTIEGWDNLTATKAGLLLLAFFIWVTFWSFLTSNFRPALMRRYEGSWNLPRLEKWRSSFWEARYAEFNRTDLELENQMIGVEGLTRVLRDLWASLKDQRPDVSSNEPRKFDGFLASLETITSADEPPSSQVLQGQTATAAGWRKQMKPKLPEAENPDDDSWETRRRKLEPIIQKLKDFLPKIEDVRLKFDQDFSRYFAPAGNVRPTQLGNVMKTVEVGVWKRYRLDVVVIWSRLQSELPKEFAETLQDAKMSLDLMITLSAYILFFGGILAAWFSRRLSIETETIAPLMLVLALPLVARFALGLDRQQSIYIAVFAIFGLLWVPFVAIWVMVINGFWEPLVWFGNTMVRIEFFVMLMIVVCFLSWAVYTNAVQASLSYAEKLQASFDLYRWKVLEGFHLQLPPSFQEERQMWQEVSDLLSRSKPPSAEYYKYVKQDHTKEPALSKVMVPVLKNDKAAYESIEETDLIDVAVLTSKVVEDTAMTKQELVGKISVHKLTSHEPVRRSTVIEPEQLKDTMAVGISGTARTTLGGSLECGDRIDAIVIPAKPKYRPAPEPIKYDNLLVLDVNKVKDSEFVVVVALPSDRWQEFAALSVNSQIIIAHRTMSSSV